MWAKKWAKTVDQKIGNFFGKISKPTFWQTNFTSFFANFLAYLWPFFGQIIGQISWPDFFWPNW